MTFLGMTVLELLALVGFFVAMCAFMLGIVWLGHEYGPKCDCDNPNCDVCNPSMYP